MIIENKIPPQTRPVTLPMHYWQKIEADARVMGVSTDEVVRRILYMAFSDLYRAKPKGG